MSGFAVSHASTSPDVFAYAEPSDKGSDYHDAYGIGEKSIVEGAHCDRQPQSAACFLPATVRHDLADRFAGNVDAASNAYLRAIEELKTEMLVAKDDELPLWLSIALDLASTQIVGAIAKAIGPALASVRQVAPTMDAAAAGVAKQEIAQISSSRIESMTKAGFSGVTAKFKKQAAHDASKHPAPSHDDKAESIGYLDQLRDSVDVAYNRFALDAIAESTDAELIVLWHGMDRRLHTTGAYKAALKAKLDRFKHSGVTKILAETTYGQDLQTGNFAETRRVVFVQGPSGKVPWFQRDRQSSIGHDRNLVEPVPTEFREVAIARSEQMWGPTPTVKTEADSFLEAFGHYTR
jgi:hypothetical protein